MKVYKPYTRKEYADLAVYCNLNDCHIVDKKKYLESVPNEHPEPTPVVENIEELQKEVDEYEQAE